MSAADVVNAEGVFAANSLLTSAEQKATNSLTNAFSDALTQGAEVAGVAQAFVVGMMTGEAAISSLAAGAGVAAAAEAGATVAGAVATQSAAAAAVGPAAPVVAAAFVLVDIALNLWGAHGGVGCCGDPPDPRPWPYIDGKLMPFGTDRIFRDLGISFTMTTETKKESLARALKQAKEANATGCGGNRTYEDVVGHYPPPRKGSFQEYAYAVILGAIEHGGLFKCWPIGKVNWTKLLAITVESWNKTHRGPVFEYPFLLGEDKHNNLLSPDPLTWALTQAIPPDGQKTVSTGQTSGFTWTDVPTWKGNVVKPVILRINVGPHVGALIPGLAHLPILKKPAAKPSAKPVTKPSRLAPRASVTHLVGTPIEPSKPKLKWIDRPTKVLAGATPKEATVGAGIIGGVTWALKFFL